MISKDGTTKSIAEGFISVVLRSNQLKLRLCEMLQSHTIRVKLGDEIPSGNGGRIDVVALLHSGQHELYEIKPALLARNAIREAIPQLLEYAYRRGGLGDEKIAKLVIVSQARLDKDSDDYLIGLRRRGLPLHYLQIPLG